MTPTAITGSCVNPKRRRRRRTTLSDLVVSDIWGSTTTGTSGQERSPDLAMRSPCRWPKGVLTPCTGANVTVMGDDETGSYVKTSW
jgi:acyl-coenzyme A synthetase/AMP-(fatty) acid ligase